MKKFAYTIVLLILTLSTVLSKDLDLSKLEKSDRNIVELGRSCVAKDYRGGIGMHLLWDGLGD